MHQVFKAVDQVPLIIEAVAGEAGRLLAGAPVAHATVDAAMLATAAHRDPTVLLTRDVPNIKGPGCRLPARARGGCVACTGVFDII